MISIAIVDTGPLVAGANRADPAHDACMEILRSEDLMLTIPAFCLAEASYIVGRSQGARIEALFLRGLKDFDVQAPTEDDLRRMAALIEEPSETPMSATDASVVALAERLGTDLILTLDRRHFDSVTPRHCDGFRLLP